MVKCQDKVTVRVPDKMYFNAPGKCISKRLDLTVKLNITEKKATMIKKNKKKNCEPDIMMSGDLGLLITSHEVKVTVRLMLFLNE